MMGIALIDFAQPLQGPAAPRLRHAFGAPRRVWVARTPAEVRPVLEAVHAAAQQGRWCLGYVRYEAAAAFDPALRTHAAGGPLAWFAEHDAPAPWPEAADRSGPPAQVAWTPALTRAQFDGALQRMQAAIRAGELYQINFTAPLHGVLQQGDGAALFAALQRAQPGGYAAHIDAGGEQVLSVSPELFFDWRDDDPAGGHILARPMKGTAPRGATPAQDAAHAEHLRTAPKERAENVMIVDLLRNDLSRIALPHTVQVPALFHTEPLPTVWQMTSDVTARTRPGTTLADVFAALFPCGSVTGAPKVRAMQLIRELEAAPRGVYCGAVGVVRPAGPPGAQGRCAVAATFNVPIRTVVLRTAADRNGAVAATCGIGSGITADAGAQAEWLEWRHKRAFVERASMPFEILETLGLHEGKFPHADLHVRRMGEAAAHFGYAFNAHAVRQELQVTALRHLRGHWRVRLLLAPDGSARAEAFALQPTAEPVRLQLAAQPFEAAHSEFVRYKTTRREHYAAFAPTTPGVFDTVLWNPAGEITEGTFGNLAAQLQDGRWITPPLSCGLLPGVGRALALSEGRVTEAVLRVDDLPSVRGWAFINSLRGWLAAELQPAAP
ncbi:MAG: chorismate-binding protein [Acidovorax sp.]|uniref:chorismate-binding protein n=1 Tax=Acidovorax sp. TaxID=1872122 RepID=UPI0025C44860|nr:chorismate-binding protein [Acidovorax sp.]MCE1194595.1 chorismate-binding protein [Acidovorax sp.]